MVREFCSTRAEWDNFAQAVGASFRCAFSAAWAWQFEHHLTYRLRRFEIFAQMPDGDLKVGQCAIGMGRRWRVFTDGLQLTSTHQERWREAMWSMLSHLGPGRYVYGSEWTLEPSREDCMDTVPGITLTEIYRTDLKLIDFRDWASWEHYRKGISSNVKRNVAKSISDGGERNIEIGRGLRGAFQLYRMRYLTYRRKALASEIASRVVRAVFRTVATYRYYEFGIYRRGRKPFAAYGGIRFGINTFFLEGGARVNNNGAAWHLTLCMIERAWKASAGRGVFVFGTDDGSQAGDKAWDGLALSRRQCRAKSIPISVIRFQYDPLQDRKGHASDMKQHQTVN